MGKKPLWSKAVKFETRSYVVQVVMRSFAL